MILGMKNSLHYIILFLFIFIPVKYDEPFTVTRKYDISKLRYIINDIMLIDTQTPPTPRTEKTNYDCLGGWKMADAGRRRSENNMLGIKLKFYTYKDKIKIVSLSLTDRAPGKKNIKKIMNELLSCHNEKCKNSQVSFIIYNLDPGENVFTQPLRIIFEEINDLNMKNIDNRYCIPFGCVSNTVYIYSSQNDVNNFVDHMNSIYHSDKYAKYIYSLDIKERDFDLCFL